MSDAFYNKMAATARRLIAKFGYAVTITRTTGEVIDDVTGAVTPGTDTVYTPQGILTTYKAMEIDGTRIQQDDRRLVLDDTIAPLLTDKPTINGKVWNIMHIENKEPAGVPLVYFVQVRA